MKNNGPVYNLTTGIINFPIDDRVAIDPEGHIPCIISLQEKSTSQSMTVWLSIRKVTFLIVWETILQ